MSSFSRKILSWFDFSHLSFYLILATLFFLPLFFFSPFRDVFHLPKELFLTAVVLLLFFFGLAESFRTRKFFLRRSVFDIPFLVFLILLAISTIFSLSTHLSMWGKMDGFVLHFFGMTLFVFWSWQIIQQIGNEKFFRYCLGSLFLSSTLSSIFFLSPDIFFLKEFFHFKNISTIGTTGSLFGLWSLTLLFLSLGILLPRGRKQILLTLFSVVSFFSVFVSLLRLDFRFVWVLLCIGTGLLFLLGMTFLGQVKKYMLAFVFLLFLFSLVKMLFPGFLSFARALPSEVNLSFSLSAHIAKETLFETSKNFLIGSGPGTFVYDFSLFRPKELNATAYFWNFRFDQSYNTIFALLSEFGVLGMISFTIIILLAFGSVFSSVWHIKSQKFTLVRFEYLTLMIAWILLTIGMFLLVFNFTLWFLWWTLFAFVILGLSYIDPNLIREHHRYFQIGPQYFLVIAFFGLLLSVGTVLLSSFIIKFTLAEYYISQIEAEPSKTNIFYEKALFYHPKNSEYLLNFALERYRQASSVFQQNPQHSAQLLSEAIDINRQAKDLDPNNVRTWEMLVGGYMQTFPFLDQTKAKSSIDRALLAVDEAIRLEYNNPILHANKAVILKYAGEFDEAEKEYLVALELKKDYFDSVFDLGKMYEEQNMSQKAIDLYTQQLSDAPQNIELLYQLGRLWYNQKTSEGDKKAQELWGKVVTLEPNSSNALYSLGLLAEKQGNFLNARRYFEKVKELAPNNQDIEKKLQSLPVP